MTTTIYRTWLFLFVTFQNSIKQTLKKNWNILHTIQRSFMPAVQMLVTFVQHFFFLYINGPPTCYHISIAFMKVIKFTYPKFEMPLQKLEHTKLLWTSHRYTKYIVNISAIFVKGVWIVRGLVAFSHRTWIDLYIKCELWGFKSTICFVT